MNWLRLWHDMPTDPKFRTVAKISKQPLSSVIAVYVFLMVDASCHAMSRGVTLCHNEDISSALDLEISQIESIKKAMQGKLLEGNKLTGWEKRQPKKEDETALERQRRHREQKKEESCHALSRFVTPCHDREDKRREEEIKDKTFMSGKPDDATQKNSEIKKQAQEVLDFLNSKTGRCYRPVETNLKLIMSRLKSGASVMDCRQVIAKKTREWRNDEKMSEYLRPATLFNATKFEQYVGELVEADGGNHVEQN